MHLLALPAFDDNYIWILHDGAAAVVVDPGDAAPVIETLRAQQLTLAAVLVTHHHADHVGGLDALWQACGNAATTVYLPAGDGVPASSHTPGTHSCAARSRRRTPSPPIRSTSPRGPTTTSRDRARDSPV